MADLVFVYGTMESGKTTKLMQDNHNYRKHGHKVVIIKPLIDTKGDKCIVNRMNESLEVNLLLGKDDSLLFVDNLKIIKNAKALLVDEAQFLSKKQIEELWVIAHTLDIHVNCYGLKSDFLGMPFEGTAALLGHADIKTELTVNCECGKMAIFNARKVNGKFTNEGDTVAIDGEDKVTYVPLCSDCYIKNVYGQGRANSIKNLVKKIK